MRTVLTIALGFILIAGSQIDLDARGRSGGGMRSRPSPSRSRSAPRKTAPRKAKSSLTNTRKPTTAKPKAKATSSTDKALAKKNSLAAQKYGSRTSAQQDFKKQMASDPKYTNKFASEPTQRPSHIPESVNRGGSRYDVAYNNGGYGYYQTDPMSGLRTWMMLDMATDMMVTNAMLRSHGYGTYTTSGSPVIHQETAGSAAVKVIVIFAVILIGGAMFYIIVKASS